MSARREANTRWARRKRQRELDAARRNQTRCPRKQGLGVCGGALQTITNGTGSTFLVCEYCERRERGICRDCPHPVYGTLRKAIRCAECAENAKREQLRKYHDRNRAEVNARARQALAEMSPEQKARRNEVKRLWRKANPDKLKAMKQRYTAKYGRKKDSRYIEYHRKYNAQSQRQKKKREQAIAAYYNQNPVRPDPHCAGCGESIPWTPLPGGKQGRPAKWCDRCCSPYELKKRIQRRAIPHTFTETPAVPIKRPRGLKVRNPQPHRYAESGERLCLTEGCDTVLTHRKKKCSRCKAREAEEARRKLASIGGGYSRPTRKAA